MNVKITNTRKQQPGRRNGGKWVVTAADGKHLGEIESVYAPRWDFNEWGKSVCVPPKVREYKVAAVQEGYHSLACATFKTCDYGSAKAAMAAAKAWVADC